MPRSELSPDSSQRSIASRRHAAVAAFIDTTRRLLPDPDHATREQLQGVAAALEALGQRSELFPIEQFPIAEQEAGQVYRLSQDVGGQYALYLSARRPGTSQAAHDHTTWAVIAGVVGNERNVFYRREHTGDPARDRLVQQQTIDVVPGVSAVLTPTDVHTIEVIGSQAGLHLHFYGRALEHLFGRVVFEGNEGGTFKPFGPPKSIHHALVTPQALKAALADGEEIAVLDVREAGVFARRHILLAASAPLWRLEVLIDRLVPRRTTRIVLVDADESLSHQAAAKLTRLGWRNVSVLAGGTEAWAAAGYEVFSGNNVLSKAFGELIEVEKHTPSISADELEQRIQRGDDIVVVDSRTPEEFTAFSLPFAHSLPGAELVLRIQEIAPNPHTFVVVNCAGRTRSIVGAQTLIDAGIPNRVASLRDGTMAWLLSGRAVAHGRFGTLPTPGTQSLAAARERAADVAQRSGVRRINATELARLEAESHEHSLYRLDVRTREEYLAGHLEGWRWAAGGQLVQATDEYVATRHARIVLADWDGVRALTTGAWLAQLGGYEVYTYQPETYATLVPGEEAVRVQQLHAPAATVSARTAAQLLQQGAQAFDVERRTAYERHHAVAARFAVPDRLEEFLTNEPANRVVLLFSQDGVLAHSVAAELAARSGRDVHSVTGGTRAWVEAGLPVASGADGVLTGDDDGWLSPYHHADTAARDAGFQAYLDWEIGLVEQLQREGDIGIRLVPPVAH